MAYSKNELMKYKEIVSKYFNKTIKDKEEREKIENNPKFWASMIVLGNRIDLYEECPVDVRKDYDFVSTLLDNFPNSPQIISVACRNYVDLNEKRKEYKDEKSTEILVRTVESLKKEYKKSQGSQDESLKSDLVDLGTDLKTRYYYNLKDYKIFYPDANDFGFNHLCTTYNNNEYISDYCAKMVLGDIINDNRLAYQISYLENVQKIGTDNTVKNLTIEEKIPFILGIIQTFDRDLFTYACSHERIYKEMVKKVRNELAIAVMYGPQLPTSNDKKLTYKNNSKKDVQ